MQKFLGYGPHSHFDCYRARTEQHQTPTGRIGRPCDNTVARLRKLDLSPCLPFLGRPCTQFWQTHKRTCVLAPFYYMYSEFNGDYDFAVKHEPIPSDDDWVMDVICAMPKSRWAGKISVPPWCRMPLSFQGPWRDLFFQKKAPNTR